MFMLRFFLLSLGLVVLSASANAEECYAIYTIFGKNTHIPIIKITEDRVSFSVNETVVNSAGKTVPVRVAFSGWLTSGKSQDHVSIEHGSVKIWNHWKTAENMKTVTGKGRGFTSSIHIETDSKGTPRGMTQVTVTSDSDEFESEWTAKHRKAYAGTIRKAECT